MKEMNPTVYRRKCFLINLAYFIVIAAVAILVIRYALSALMPFVIAAISAAILRPVLKLLNERLKLPRKITGVVITLVFYLFIALIAVIVFDKLIDGVTAFVASLPEIWTFKLMPALKSIGLWLGEKLTQMNITLNISVEEMLAPLGSGITGLSTTLLGMAGGIAFSLPSMLINVIICIVSTLFMLFDWDRITGFVFRQMSGKAGGLTRRILRQIGHTIKKFVFSYGLIMLVTFAELSIGMNIIGIKNAFLIAAVISIFDILPVVGCGGILIPWALVNFVLGNLRVGIGVSVMYLVITVVRNVLEPRIVGQQVGLHPLVTLLSMVIGSSLMGGVGLLGLPVTLAVLNQMNAEGVIHIFKHRTDTGNAAEAENTEETGSTQKTA